MCHPRRGRRVGAQAGADVYTRIQMVMASRLRLEKGTSVLRVLRGGAENWRMEQV
jgi:hypothetical protein